MADFYHLCFAVRSIEDATAEMGAALGVRWSPVRSGQLGQWPYRIVFSVAGPPFFEIVEGPPGSPWDVTTTGPRFDHIGYWSDDLERDRAELTRRGAPVEVDACPYGRPFTYHRLASIGSRVELVDVAARPGWIENWAPGAPPMPPLDLGPQAPDGP